MTQQNRSSAVMQQRNSPRDSLDDFPTPPWGTRALMEFLFDTKKHPGSCLEPTANRGAMVHVLTDWFAVVLAADVADYGAGFSVQDYMAPDYTPPRVDWVITNPPFNRLQEFILRALSHADEGVAMLTRVGALAGQRRFDSIYRHSPPSDVLIFTERLPMFQGRLDPKRSTATDYGWLVWRRPQIEFGTTRLHWIPPSRDRLTRPGDYTFKLLGRR